MEVAKRIQTSLLPQNRRVGGYDVAARMQPAAEVGGDYYDIIQAGEDRNWIAIGDVSGHGVESGLVMMMTQTSILSLVQREPAPVARRGVQRGERRAAREHLPPAARRAT